MTNLESYLKFINRFFGIVVVMLMHTIWSTGLYVRDSMYFYTPLLL